MHYILELQRLVSLGSLLFARCIKIPPVRYVLLLYVCCAFPVYIISWHQLGCLIVQQLVCELLDVDQWFHVVGSRIPMLSGFGMLLD